MKRMIANRMQDTKTVQENLEGVFGVKYDLVLYLYKDKEPVYYSFLAGCPYTAICNALEYTACVGTTTDIINRNKGAIKKRTLEDFIAPKNQTKPVKKNRTKIPIFMLTKLINIKR